MPSGYWAERQRQLLGGVERDERRVLADLAREYRRHERELRDEIAAYYARYGRGNVIEYRALLQALPDADREQLIERMEEFFRAHPEHEYLREVRETVYRLDRLEGMQANIWLHQMEIGEMEEAEFRAHLEMAATEAGNLAAEALGHGPGFLDVNSSVIAATMSKTWAEGKNWSARIWDNRERLAGYLADDFAKGIARGETYESLCRQLMGRFQNVSRRDAMRLIYTEGTFVINEAQALVFAEDFEEYDVVTVGDGRVCDACKKLEKAGPFRIADRVAGVNFPPIHPWCRCSTVPHVEDWDAWIDAYVERGGAPVGA